MKVTDGRFLMYMYRKHTKPGLLPSLAAEKNVILSEFHTTQIKHMTISYSIYCTEYQTCRVDFHDIRPIQMTVERPTI